MGKTTSQFKQWQEQALKNGIGYHTFRNRVYKSNWSMEAAATIPPGERKANFKAIDDYDLMEKNFDLFLQKGIEEQAWEKQQERKAPVPREWKLQDLVYLVKYLHVDGLGGMAFHFTRRVKEIRDKVNELQQNGDWDLYAGLSDEEYEKIILSKERKSRAKQLIGC
ncbi:hypothetical protein [Paenibacillus gallinarum]|uniref:Uncharacterized protein n=1 Tax=Paenibacillus gallinarum TaxID=2762232 RepID=A0ABR8SXA1_9BACL|nr:hypothetical protein [Paenibacillus gallinarum]MBD7967724.1 hypothetical protein [Paenibacillus gallinarum]